MLLVLMTFGPRSEEGRMDGRKDGRKDGWNE
jgi:hypothetical protein